MAFCTNCGQQLANGEKYCANCGKSASPNASNTERKIVFDGEIHKCPHCGQELKAFETVCPNPQCGIEIRGKKATSSVSKLVKKIEELDRKKNDVGFLETFKRKLNGSKLFPIEEQKISLISNFPIPNTKEDILEFMILSSSHILSKKPKGNISQHDELLYNELKKAWKIKFEQAYDKAKICIKNDEHRAEIEQCYNKTIVVPKKKRKKNILIVLLSVFMSLILIFTGIALITKFTADPNAIKVGVSYEDVKGQYYEDVIEIFEKNGFTNIEARKDEWHIFHKSGTVKSVTIDGKKEFYSFSKFSSDAKIIIFYYE